MSDELIDVRTPLAASKRTRVEIGADGVLHVLAGPVTLHMDRAMCEELTTTLARAMVALSKSRPKPRPLSVVRTDEHNHSLERSMARTAVLPPRASARFTNLPREIYPEIHGDETP